MRVRSTPWTWREQRNNEGIKIKRIKKKKKREKKKNKNGEETSTKRKKGEGRETDQAWPKICWAKPGAAFSIQANTISAIG